MAAFEYDELTKIAQLFKKWTGITLDEGKLRRAARKIESVMKEFGFESFGAFYHALRFAKDERVIQALINAVTINETYFWREHEQFDVLVEEILPKLAQKSDRIRLLVAPSSSGEELYSLMMAILEEGDVIRRVDIEMVGMDIDSSMIERAKKGIYGKRSVEKLPKNLLKKYFRQDGNLYIIDENLRKNATFIVANIFDENLVEKIGRFDILFSRNMLIYFNLEEKMKCFAQFERLLKSGGYLFLGHADAHHIDKKRFQPLGYGLPIYRKP